MAARSDLIEERIQEPLENLRDAADIVVMVEFEAVRLDALQYYFDHFLQGFFADAVNDELKGNKLQRLAADVVKQVGFLLLADYLAQLGDRLVTPKLAKADPKWLGKFLQRMAKLAGITEKPLLNLAVRGPLNIEKLPPLVAKLSGELGMSMEKLLMLQPLMVENALEEVLAPPKKKRPTKKKQAGKRKK